MFSATTGLLSITGDGLGDEFGITENVDGTVSLVGTGSPIKTKINGFNPGESYTTTDIVLTIVLNLPAGPNSSNSVVLSGPGNTSGPEVKSLTVNVGGAASLGLSVSNVYDFGPLSVVAGTVANAGGSFAVNVDNSQFSAMTIAEAGGRSASVELGGDTVGAAVSVTEGLGDQDSIALDSGDTFGSVVLVQGAGPAVAGSTGAQDSVTVSGATLKDLSISQGDGAAVNVTVTNTTVALTSFGVHVQQGNGAGDMMTLGTITAPIPSVPVTDWHSGPAGATAVQGDGDGDSIALTADNLPGTLGLSQGNGNGDRVTATAVTTVFTLAAGSVTAPSAGDVTITQGNGYADAVDLGATNTLETLSIVQGDSIAYPGSTPMLGNTVDIEGTVVIGDLSVVQGDASAFGNSFVTIAASSPVTVDDWTHVVEYGDDNFVILGGANDPSGTDFGTAYLDVFTGAGGGAFVQAANTDVAYGSNLGHNYVVEFGADGNTYSDGGGNKPAPLTCSLSPTLTWPAPADISSGTALGPAQLDAAASVPGTFTYTPALGTVLPAGMSQTLSVTFTPADSADYNPETLTTTINVDSPPSIVTWLAPADITFGTPLGPAQLDAIASIPGTFAYTPATGTVLSAGADQTLSVLFTPEDTADYQPATVTVNISVDMATPTLTWANPSAIAYGTALGPAQLNATASVPGVFTYAPAAGTILNAGPDQTLSVTFSPTDSVDYTPATATVAIDVAQTTPTVNWPTPAPITAGTALGPSQLNATASVPGTFVYTPPAGTVLGVGQGQALSVLFLPTDSADDVEATTTTSIDVEPAPVAGKPSAPALAPGSDTGISNSDGITKDNGSAAAPLTFTVGGVSPSDGFVQLYDITDPSAPVPLGIPVQAQDGTVTITLRDTTLTDEPHQIAAAVSLTADGAPGPLSAATMLTVQTSLVGKIVSPNPAIDFYNATTLPNGGQVVVQFSHWLAGITVNPTTGYASPPFSVMLIPAGPDGLQTEAATGVFWSAPTGYDDGTLPVPATLSYSQNADGTSTITLTPQQPLSTDIYLVSVSGALSDLAGNPLQNSAGVPGTLYASFDYRPSAANTTPPHVTAVTTENGTVAVDNNGIPQPDTIGIRFDRAMDTYTINADTIQLYATGHPTPLPAAVAYNPSTQSAYLTPETVLLPNTTYTVVVSTAVTDDQGFPQPGNALAANFAVEFTVITPGAAGGSGPLAVVGESPVNGTVWIESPGYGTVTFNEPISLGAFSRFSAMLVTRTGGVTTGTSDNADVPLNAKLAFNPNTDQLIIVPTGLMPGKAIIYTFVLQNITAQYGGTLAGPVYATFELNDAAQTAVATRGSPATIDAAVPSIPAGAPMAVLSADVARPTVTEPTGKPWPAVRPRISVLNRTARTLSDPPRLKAAPTQDAPGSSGLLLWLRRNAHVIDDPSPRSP